MPSKQNQTTRRLGEQHPPPHTRTHTHREREIGGGGECYTHLTGGGGAYNVHGRDNQMRGALSVRGVIIGGTANFSRRGWWPAPEQVVFKTAKTTTPLFLRSKRSNGQ